MPRRKILIADLLCGAGGSTTGALRALTDLGFAASDIVVTCVNHWPTAIETHTKNHPEARHYCQDISTVRPHLVVPEGYLDLLMASPTCTHHSVARGGKPTSDQQRSDPWHIITWLTELRVKRMIIENVWEFCQWGPVDPRTGKPIQSRKGEYFRAWVDTIRRFGYDPEWRKLNAADYGDATTRQRFILMARSDRRSVSWPVPTHMKLAGNEVSLFPTQKPWRPAREIIDWQIKGQSIFRRPIPLAPKTLLRIGAGAVKFGWPRQFIDLLEPEMTRSLEHVARTGFAKRHEPAKKVDRLKLRKRVRWAIGWLRRIRRGERVFTPGASSAAKAEPMVLTLRNNMAGSSLAEPVPTVAANGKHIGLAEPVLVNMKGKSTATAIDEPTPTQTSHAGHLAVAEPVIMNGRKGNKATGVSAAPVPTLDTKGGVWLAEPMILSQHNSGAARSAGEPLPTITTGGAAAPDHPGCARPMLVEPFMVTVAHGNDIDEKDPNSRRARSIDEPLQTIHAAGGKFGVAEPFTMSRQSCGAPRGVEEPIPTQTAQHSPVLISPYYGSGSGETCQSAEEPLPTVTSKGRFGMVVPVTHSDGSQRARDVDQDPLPTLTTANRGELAFITAAFGEREGQEPRTHDIAQPTPTICATGRVNLVEADGQTYDILFRMLEPHELAAAMGFTTEEAQYEFAGTKTDQIKQIGNAVSVAKMKACVKALMADAEPKRQTAGAPAESEEAA